MSLIVANFNKFDMDMDPIDTDTYVEEHGFWTFWYHYVICRFWTMWGILLMRFPLLWGVHSKYIF